MIKTCSKCGKEFYRPSTKHKGSRCPECVSEYSSEYNFKKRGGPPTNKICGFCGKNTDETVYMVIYQPREGTCHKKLVKPKKMCKECQEKYIEREWHGETL